MHLTKFKELSIRFNYDGLSEIMRIIDMNNLQIMVQSYHQEASITIRIRETEFDKINDLFSISPHVIAIETLPG
jgi:putative IMPACT (imprinted ancient) family translation regulator